MILCGDFHQFPPVAEKKTAALYYPANAKYNTEEECLGSELYACFRTVVTLSQQMRVTDEVWMDLPRIAGVDGRLEGWTADD